MLAGCEETAGVAVTGGRDVGEAPGAAPWDVPQADRMDITNSKSNAAVYFFCRL